MYMPVFIEILNATYLVSFRSTAIICGDDQRTLLEHLFSLEKDIKKELVQFLKTNKWKNRDYKIRLSISSNPEPGDM